MGEYCIPRNVELYLGVYEGKPLSRYEFIARKSMKTMCSVTQYRSG
jgi:hypothetical protein